MLEAQTSGCTALIPTVAIMEPVVEDLCLIVILPSVFIDD